MEEGVEDEVDIHIQQEHENDMESNTSNTREESGSKTSDETFSSSEGFSNVDIGDDLNLYNNEARDLVVDDDRSMEDNIDSNSEAS